MVLNIELNKMKTNDEYDDKTNDKITELNGLIDDIKVYGGKTLKSGKVIRPKYILESTTKYADELEQIYDEYGLICSLIYYVDDDGKMNIDNDNKKDLVEEYFTENTINNQKVFFYFLKIIKAIRKTENIEKWIKKQKEQKEQKELENKKAQSKLEKNSGK